MLETLRGRVVAEAEAVGNVPEPRFAFAAHLFARMPDRFNDLIPGSPPALTWFSNGLPELVIGARIQNTTLRNQRAGDRQRGLLA